MTMCNRLLKHSVLLCTVVVTMIASNVLAQDFHITDHGAKGDGRTLNTASIQSAIDAAHERGGGRVVVPAGRFLTGALLMKSGVDLHVMKDAVLLGSTDPEHYFKLSRWKALVIAEGQNNISITGRGEIDGQGRKLALHLDSLFYAGEMDSVRYNFVERRPKYYMRPQLIEFVECNNITVKNITLKNAACWVQTHERCRNIMIDSVTTYSDAYWNNDGIDISDCINVRITNCDVNSADDGICIKSQSRDYMCDSIYIDNCTVRSSASAVKFGTVSHGGFRNVVIRNIKVYDTFRSAIAIECVDGGILEDVLVENIKAVNTGNAIFVRLGYRTQRDREPGVLRNVTLRNIDVEVAFERPDYEYEIRGPDLPFFHNTFPSSITGIPGHPVQNLLLENINIRYPGRGNDGLANVPVSRLDEVPEKIADYPEFSMFGELPAWAFYVRHVEGLVMRDVRISAAALDYRPAFVFDDAHGVEVESLQIDAEAPNRRIVLHNSSNAVFDADQSIITSTSRD